MSLFKRLIRYISTNGLASFCKLFHRAMSWLYTFGAVRFVVRLFYRRRQPRKWVFIVGCYNSGTTLLKEILGAHQSIACLPREGVRFTRYLAAPEDLGWTRMWSQCTDYVSMSKAVDRKTAEKIINDWSPWWGKDKDIFLEKSISNLLRMEWFDVNFENSYFIGIIRNPYCSIEGLKRKAKPGKNVSKLLEDSYPIEMIAGQCDISLNVLKESSEKVGKYFGTTYEEFVSNPIVEIIKLCKFLDLESPDMSFVNGVLTVNEIEFNLKNMNDKSINALRENEFRIINSICSENIAAFGYETVN